MKVSSSRLQLCVLTAALSLLAGAAAAKDPPREKDGVTAPALGAPPAPAAAAQAPNARLVALIKAGGKIVKHKGVDSVTRSGTGIYCIKPLASTGIDPATAIVILTVDFFYSTRNEVKVQSAASGSGCGSTRIGVYTLADIDATGLYTFSNGVGFSILVP
jgi:hypothetical protein